MPEDRTGEGVAAAHGGTYAIEGIFVDFNGQGNGCADCHTTAMHTQIPAGNLDLDPSESPSPYVNLINVVNAEDSSLIYVVPNRPHFRASLRGTETRLRPARSLAVWADSSEPVSAFRIPVNRVIFREFRVSRGT